MGKNYWKGWGRRYESWILKTKVMIEDKFIISICGGSGCGKSTIAKELVLQLGEKISSRIPTDYFLKENIFNSVEEYLARPLEYDWELLEVYLKYGIDTELSSPDFDFVSFKRRNNTGGKIFSIKNIMIIDSMIPYPKSNIFIKIEVPEEVRYQRIIERDQYWNTSVIKYWGNHCLTKCVLDDLDIEYVEILDGRAPAAINAKTIAKYIVSLL